MADDITYPCLMIHPSSGLIVKMESRCGDNGAGAVVGTGQRDRGTYGVGSHSSTWAIDNFKLFTGAIE